MYNYNVLVHLYCRIDIQRFYIQRLDIHQQVCVEDDQSIADCVIFCASDLGIQALESFNKFGKDELTSHIPAILFVDQNQQMLVERAKVARHRVILSMPIRLKQLRSILLKLFRAREKAESSVEA